MTKKQRKMLMRIIVAAVMTAALVVLPDVEMLPLGGVAKGLLYYLVVYGIIGYDILRKSWKGIMNGRVFDENFLMAVATVGAFSLALYEQSGDYLEAIAVMLFYQVGEFFQSYAVGKSRKSITDLMDIRPDYANIEEDGQIVKVDPDDVEVGQVIIVRPGEKIPIDGIVTEGESELNTSALTGESEPRKVVVGSEIISGSINMMNTLKVRTTTEFGESTVSRILELVEDSASHKSTSEDFIARFASIYTPAVCYSALALALLPPLVLWLLSSEPMWNEWIYRALTFLVISCPCALVVSIPLTFFAGIGGASREGVLVKGANILEQICKVRTIAFDKTGTLTYGMRTDEKGNAIPDCVKKQTPEALRQLRQLGIGHIAMLSGDVKATVDRIAQGLDIDTIHSQLLPADKVALVEQLLSSKKKDEMVAFVGDGINDAPVLTRADIGIAMGGIGTDAAIEAADVVLMDDDPTKVATAIRISRRTLAIVWQNIIMALGIKGVCLLLGAIGIANMWLAIFADVGVMILAVLNAIRAMYVPKNCINNSF